MKLIEWIVLAIIAIVLMFIVAVFVHSQTLYVPVSPGIVKEVKLTPGLNVMTDLSGAVQNPYPAIPGVLLAEMDTVIGQAAYDQCMAKATTPEMTAMAMPSCDANRRNAMVNDALMRTKIMMQNVPVDLLASFKLSRIQ